MECDKCNRLAAVHVSETRGDGTVVVTHYCVPCATVAGYPYRPGSSFEHLKELIERTEELLRRKPDSAD